MRRWKEDGKKNYPMTDEHSHWNPSYLPNDIMTPVVNIYRVLTTFTLEFMNLTHVDLIADMEKV